MLVIDASSIVHAWDNYPIENFPKFWKWLEEQFLAEILLIPAVGYDEVGHVSPDCLQWLSDNSIGKIYVNMAVARHAQQIKTALGIDNDKYSSGVDENDIIIVATAKSYGVPLISNEGQQLSLPLNKKKYKIPAVCAMSEVGTSCLNIAQYIKQSKQVF